MIEQICQAPLKGNVRELENLLHRAVALSEGGELQIDFMGEQTMPAPLTVLPDAPVSDAVVSVTGALSAGTAIPIPTDLQSHLDRQEREILVQTLRETGFNRTAAAARLGLSLRQIRYRIARLRIDDPAGEAPDDTD